MSRTSKAFLAVVTVSLLGFATPAVFGFDVPNPKPKNKDKDKDKKKNNDAASGDSKAADSTAKSDNSAPAKSDNSAPAAKDDSAAKTADAPPPAQTMPAQTLEVKFPKSLWETSGAKDMKAGDWVEGEMPMVPGSKTRQEVLEVGDHYTVVVNKSTMMGTTTEQKMKTIYSEPDPDPKAVEKQRQEQKIETKEFADKLTIKGKEVACTRYETYQDGKLVSKSWVSKDVPMGGAVKAEMADGKVVSAITDFGRGK